MEVLKQFIQSAEHDLAVTNQEQLEAEIYWKNKHLCL